MTIYRSTEPQTVYVKGLGRDVPMDPDQPFDDQDPEQAVIIAEWGPKGRGKLVADNLDVETATAAPGEKRTARRTASKAKK